jgi:putative sugar O-methyltransferase
VSLSPDTRQVLDDITALQRAMPEKDQGYWARLGAKHTTLIATHGIEHFKRTINFEYAQWAVGTWRHGFIRSLIVDLARRGRPPLGLLARYDRRDLEHVVWAANGPVDPTTLRPFAAYVGLLWQLAQTRDRIGCLEVEEPKVGDPLPVSYFGRLISLDLAMCAHDLNTIASLTDLSQVNRVLEIGAGYGRMAHVLASLRPGVEYTIVDIPPAIAVSKYYLSRVIPEAKVRFVLPQGLSALASGSFDLAFNISSFDEMPAAFSVQYLQEIALSMVSSISTAGRSRACAAKGGSGSRSSPIRHAGNRSCPGGIQRHRYSSRKRFAFRRSELVFRMAGWPGRRSSR